MQVCLVFFPSVSFQVTTLGFTCLTQAAFWKILCWSEPPENLSMCEFIWNLVCVHSHIHVSICLFIHPSVCPSVSPLDPSVIAVRSDLGIQSKSRPEWALPQRSSWRKGPQVGVVRCIGQEWAADSGGLRGKSAVLYRWQ